MKQVITWLGKPVKLIGPVGRPLHRKSEVNRGQYWLFTTTAGRIDGFADEADLFITVEED